MPGVFCDRRRSCRDSVQRSHHLLLLSPAGQAASGGAGSGGQAQEHQVRRYRLQVSREGKGARMRNRSGEDEGGEGRGLGWMGSHEGGDKCIWTQ